MEQNNKVYSSSLAAWGRGGEGYSGNWGEGRRGIQAGGGGGEEGEGIQDGSLWAHYAVSRERERRRGHSSPIGSHIRSVLCLYGCVYSIVLYVQH